MDILLLSRPGPDRTAFAGGNGQAVTELPGPTSYAKEMGDLERVKSVLGQALTEESYLAAKAKIRVKYGQCGESSSSAPGGG